MWRLDYGICGILIQCLNSMRDHLHLLVAYQCKKETPPFPSQASRAKTKAQS